MIQFICSGPFKLPTEKNRDGKIISLDMNKFFWNDKEKISNDVGCFIFAIQNQKIIIPMYVGKAAKSFKQETFAPLKLRKYTFALRKYKRGNPLMFFLSCPQENSLVNQTQINALKKFLVQQASC